MEENEKENPAVLEQLKEWAGFDTREFPNLMKQMKKYNADISWDVTTAQIKPHSQFWKKFRVCVWFRKKGFARFQW